MKIPGIIYSYIKRTMPIPCVDVVIIDKNRRVLLVQRGNEPGKGEWWFPGGRVLHGENRSEATLRKVFEECHILASSVEKAQEVGTYEIIFRQGRRVTSHAISTVFRITVPSSSEVRLDSQSVSFAWRSISSWQSEKLNGFVRNTLEKIEAMDHVY